MSQWILGPFEEPGLRTVISPGTDRHRGPEETTSQEEKKEGQRKVQNQSQGSRHEA